MRIERSLTDLRGDRPSGTLWCGPTAVARVTGKTYQAAELAIRVAGEGRGKRYPAQLKTTYWPDIMTAMGVLVTTAEAQTAKTMRGVPTVTQWRRHAAPGLWGVRVTGHFALIEVGPPGSYYARVYDNVQQGTPVAPKSGPGAIFGVNAKLTHAVRLGDALQAP
jgi:hypothetical protein